MISVSQYIDERACCIRKHGRLVLFATSQKKFGDSRVQLERLVRRQTKQIADRIAAHRDMCYHGQCTGQRPVSVITPVVLLPLSVDSAGARKLDVATFVFAISASSIRPTTPSHRFRDNNIFSVALLAVLAHAR
jgi:hypothetical protein